MKLNAEDGGKRTCILVTNNENGICENVTYERNRRVIQGYTNAKGEAVPGLADNSLRYYKTEFVPRRPSPRNARALMAASVDLLCVKNDLYDEVPRFFGKKLKKSAGRYFDDGRGRRMLVLFDETTGQAVMKDMVHCGINSGPHRLKFYQYGRIVYILHELQNYVGVYDCTYNEKGLPTFELKQKIATLPKNYTVPSAACVIDFSPDFKHLICANAGENTIALYDIDEETGLLTLRNILPVSGDYPKDIDIFPNGRFLVSTNHDSDSLTFFRVHYDTGTIVMNGLELPIDNPNCLRIVELPE